MSKADYVYVEVNGVWEAVSINHVPPGTPYCTERPVQERADIWPAEVRETVYGMIYEPRLVRIPRTEQEVADAQMYESMANLIAGGA